jgi:hypothetical protein
LYHKEQGNYRRKMLELRLKAEKFWACICAKQKNVKKISKKRKKSKFGIDIGVDVVI